MARALALVVVLGGFALAFALIWHGLEETREPHHDAGDLAAVWVVSTPASLGAMLLGWGTLLWYGEWAKMLRVAGFLFLLLSGLAVVTFAFLLVPLVLLAVPALFRRNAPA